MAILKSLIMRNSRKKIGGIVAYGLKGQTVGREQAAKVTNRRTTAQMSQRVRLANLVQLWKRMSFWAKKGAFQTKLQKESDYNAFVKANIKGNVAYLTKEQAEAGCSVVAPVIVAKGSLNPIHTRYDGNSELWITGLVVGDAQYSPTTLGKLAQDIIDNNDGIQNGDQLSLIKILQYNGDTEPTCRVVAHEWTLDTSDTTAYAGSDVAKWLETNTAGSETESCLVNPIDIEKEGVAFVLSRVVNGQLQVSNAQIVLSTDAQSIYDDYKNQATLAAAIKSYGTNVEDFLIPGDQV